MQTYSTTGRRAFLCGAHVLNKPITARRAPKKLRSDQAWALAAGKRAGHIVNASNGKVLEKEKPTSKADHEEEEEEEFEDLDGPESSAALSTQQVQQLVQIICNETEVAEVSLKMGDFGFKMRRKVEPLPIVIPSPDVVASNGAGPVPAIEAPFQSTASMDESQISAAQSNGSNGHTSSTDEEDWEENLIFLGAPKVGILRRGRYVKGKRVGKGNLIEEGAKVKKGQLLAFIEQLGTHVPIEAPQAGEIVTFNVEDGKAVEYKEVCIEMAPFFGGHIIGDKKHA